MVKCIRLSGTDIQKHHHYSIMYVNLWSTVVKQWNSLLYLNLAKYGVYPDMEMTHWVVFPVDSNCNTNTWMGNCPRKLNRLACVFGWCFCWSRICRPSIQYNNDFFIFGRYYANEVLLSNVVEQTPRAARLPEEAAVSQHWTVINCQPLGI